MTTVTILQNDASDDISPISLSSDYIPEASKYFDNDEKDDVRSTTGSVAVAVHHLESKELRHLLRERKEMLFEIERCHSLIDSLELKNELLIEDHEYVEKQYALCLMERRKRAMESLIEDLKLKIVQLQKQENLLDRTRIANVAKIQLSEIGVKLTPDQKQNQRLTMQLDAISSELKTGKKVSKRSFEQLNELKILMKAQKVEATGADNTNMHLEKMLQMMAGREKVEVVLNSQKASIEQLESAFKAAKVSQQKWFTVMITS
jgi:hypothetical protein